MDTPRSTPVPREVLLDRVIRAVAELGGPSRTPREGSDLEEFGFDSMKKLELLAVLEEQLEVTLTEDLLPEFKTPGRIADIVAELLDSPAQRKY